MPSLLLLEYKMSSGGKLVTPAPIIVESHLLKQGGNCVQLFVASARRNLGSTPIQEMVRAIGDTLSVNFSNRTITFPNNEFLNRR